MKVINRDGEQVVIDFEAIKSRILALCSEEERQQLDIDLIVVRTIGGIEDNITTARLDELSASISASLQSRHYLYDQLAGKILVSNLQKNVRRMMGMDVLPTFSQKLLHIDAAHPELLNAEMLAFVRQQAAVLDETVQYERDSSTGFFSYRTLEVAYLLRARGQVVESPQDMFMRVAVAMHFPRAQSEPCADAEDALSRIRSVYDSMSNGLYTHASPTLFNAGTRHEQMSSCYLLGTSDSLDGIYKTLGDCAHISKWAGGLGVHVSNVRAKGSLIRSTQGRSDGIVPMLKVFNETARYCNQSGRRKGSIAIYLEPWHADVLEFVELRRQSGAESVRARDLFLALWVPDEFMRRLQSDDDWYLMSPDDCPGLQDSHGEAFDKLYNAYIAEGRYVKKVRASQLWRAVLQAQVETGTPYIMFKDAVNRTCNQSNVGTIRSSNLCAEITQYSDAQTYAVCNLASIAVNRFVDASSGDIDHRGLHAAAGQLTRNLNRIIDINFYPTPETRASNLRMRPIGIGVQGFADLYNMLGVEYGSEAALDLDAHVMESIYHGALSASIDLARSMGPYEMFAGSPFSRGVLQFDHYTGVRFSGRWDWSNIRQCLASVGCRNSMTTALMPTASTSQILGNAEGFEPIQSNIFKRSTLAGEFMVVNKHLMRVLLKSGLWDDDARKRLLENDGSVQMEPRIPERVRAAFKTVWEVGQRCVIAHAAARAPFVDQSQSMNLYFAVPNYKKLNSALVAAWRHELKTGCYYMRSRPAAEALKVTSINAEDDAPRCTRDDKSGCIMCSA
jgi:ribonucleoside-diphosphate reductase alpha subunit